MLDFRKVNKDMTLTSYQLRNITQVICENYRYCKRKMESMENQNIVSLNMNEYADAKEYVRSVDRTLQDCSRDTQLIITKGFLMNNDPAWYLEYFSRNTFYRLRKKAVLEFLRGFRI